MQCSFVYVVIMAASLVACVEFTMVLFTKHSFPSLRQGGSRMDHLSSAGVTTFRSSAPSRRLAVVVPAHAGDLYRALASLSKWPSACSPVTQANVDLVLYKAETEDELSYGALRLLQVTAGRCFAKTKIVYGALTKEVRNTLWCLGFRG